MTIGDNIGGSSDKSFCSMTNNLRQHQCDGQRFRLVNLSSHVQSISI